MEFGGQGDSGCLVIGGLVVGGASQDSSHTAKAANTSCLWMLFVYVCLGVFKYLCMTYGTNSYVCIFCSVLLYAVLNRC